MSAAAFKAFPRAAVGLSSAASASSMRRRPDGKYVVVR
jgi:hypothetical protein